MPNENYPLIMKFAKKEKKVEALQKPNFKYDPEKQLTIYEVETAGGPSTSCMKATYSTPKVGKDPEADRSMDD